MTDFIVVVIDPYDKRVTIENLDVDGQSTYQAIKEAVFAENKNPGEHHLIQCVHLGAIEENKTIDGYVDEEGLLVDWDKQAFFSFGEGYEPLAGRMVIASTDSEGNTISLGKSLATAIALDVNFRVKWIKPQQVKVRTPTYTELDENFEPVGEPKPLGDRETWDYENQPK